MTSQIRVDEITNRSGLGTVTIYDNGFEFTGVTTFTEDVDITGGLTIGGVLTYEDVTNIDSVGVVTARGGLDVSDTGTPVNIDSTNSGLNKIHFKTGGTTSGYLGNSSTYFLSLSDSSGNQRVRHANSGLYQVLDTSGNVIHQMSGAGSIGIGTAPVGDLTVLTASNGYVDINGSGGNGAEIRFLKKSDRSQTYTIQNNGGVNELVQHVLAHSSGQYKWSIGGTERLSIDSSGHVRVNTGDLRVGDDTDSNAGSQTISVGSVSSGSGGIGIFANPTNGNSWVQFGDGTSGSDQYRGYMNYQHADDSLRFGTAASEKLRITSGGNLGVGVVSPTSRLDVVGGGIACSGWSNNNSGASGGMELGWDGAQVVLQSIDRNGGGGFQPVLLSGSEVRSNTNIKFINSGNGIDFSVTSDTSASNASASSELLDDYEEGTWTPRIINSSGSSANISAQPANRVGTYLKIGNTLLFSCWITGSLTTTETGSSIRISGLPYNCASNGNAYSALTIWNYGGFAGYKDEIIVRCNTGDDQIIIQRYGADLNFNDIVKSGINFMISGQYRV